MSKLPVDWQSILIDFMIEGGLTGRKRSEIMLKLDRYATARLLERELMFLAADDRVQKFIIPAQGRKGGRSFVVWRATTEILKMAS